MTPNHHEAEAATGVRVRSEDDARRAARLFRERAGCRDVVMTRGDQGIWLLSDRVEGHLPAAAREVADVTGAGDTVVATLALALAAGATLAEAARLANEAAGIVVGRFGPATVSVPEPRMISVSVWDKSMVGAVDRAIREANLGFNPIVDGTNLRIPLPELNEQRRKELVKIAHGYAENARVAIRNVRRDVMHELKEMLREKLVSEDDDRRAHDEVQKLTDKYVAEVDHVLADKEKELMQV